MSLTRYLRQTVSLPPGTVARRAADIVRRETGRTWLRLRDRVRPTWGSAAVSTASATRLFPPPPVEDLRKEAAEIADLARLYIEHRFDLLGSGWVRVEPGLRCAGLEGRRYDAPTPPPDRLLLLRPANRPEAARIRALIAADYRPIDWQLDFKSGYRWSERTWYRDIRYGHLPGVDVKVPWELARMQHLPLLAYAWTLAAHGEPGFLAPEAYALEFRHQLLDFIAANPPRFGVNWACTMDVAIRAAGWVTAFDLFRAAGASFDAPFTAVLMAGLAEHGRFIAANLEWGIELRANHYLADIAGLLFIAAFLPRSAETDAWLAFAVRELAVETELQFNPDGSTFEGSTSYHRLSTEMVLYATALVLGLPAEKRAACADYDRRLAPRVPGLPAAPLPLYPLPGRGDAPFPPRHFQLLEKAVAFTSFIAGPDGLVPQIGDNDSGRFLKLWPAWRLMTAREARAMYLNLEGWAGLPDAARYHDEVIGDHRHLAAAAAGLFATADGTSAGGIETHLVRGLAGGVPLPRSFVPEDEPGRVRVGGGKELEAFAAFLPAVAGLSAMAGIAFPGGDLRRGLTLAAWPDFGFWLFRSARLYLAVRCGPVGQRGNGGHAHNDQLSLLLAVDGQWIFNDPGSYLYTPLPERRNEYRSVLAHHAPRFRGGCEPGRLDLGLFRLGDAAQARCVYFGAEGFLGRHEGYGETVWRRVEIRTGEVRIIDSEAAGPAAVEGWRPSGIHHSPGYGKRLRP